MTESTRLYEDEQELQALIDKGFQGCAVSGCANTDIDSRGSVFLKNKTGKEDEYWMCSDHWEGIFYVLGRQVDEEDEPEWDESDLESDLERIGREHYTWTSMIHVGEEITDEKQENLYQLVNEILQENDR